MHFGEGLRTERERRGIALNDIALGTRVSLRNLSALESEQFGELPGGIFNRGIVRSYARFCGLDEDKLVNAFTDALRRQGIDPHTENEDWAEFAENVKRNRAASYSGKRLRWLGVAAMVLGVLVLGGAVLSLLVHRGVVQLPPRLASALHLRHSRTEGFSQPENGANP